MNSMGPERLGRLVDEHAAALVLYAGLWCSAPEDVVQEALLELVRQPSEPDNVAGWLYRVVRNRAISVSRSEARRRRREAAAARQRPRLFESSEGDRLDAAAATAALAQLAMEERETIVARLWGGLSLAEVAELTGTSTATAWRRYQSGLGALRERLGVSWAEKKTSRRR